MPLYEYACQKCEHTFEALVFNGEQVECPQCHGQRLERLLSVPAKPRGRAIPTDEGVRSGAAAVWPGLLPPLAAKQKAARRTAEEKIPRRGREKHGGLTPRRSPYRSAANSCGSRPAEPGLDLRINDLVGGPFAAAEGHDGLGRHQGHVVARLQIDPRGVGRQDDVVEVKQGVLSQRLVLEDVQCRRRRSRRARSASTRSASDTRAPRAVLIRNAVGFIKFRVRRLMMYFDSGVRGMCRLT